MPKDCYEKRPRIMGCTATSTWSSKSVLQELQICELLKQNPHPNIATYRGCFTEDGRVSGLCFTKYHQTLNNRINHDNRPFDLQHCLQGIEDGIQYLHSLGLIHYDINPVNIMLTKDDTTIIIDFNSCCEEGREGRMACTFQWTDSSYDEDCARRENDYCGLRKIREWIRDPAPFHWTHPKDGDQHQQQGHHGQLGD